MCVEIGYLKSDQTEMLEVILKIRVAISKRTLKHLESKLPFEEAQKAHDLLLEVSGISLTSNQLYDLFATRPDVRANVIENGIGDTETDDCVLDMLSNHLLGADWPRYGDDMDERLLLSFMQKQALEMGYEVKS